MLQQTSSLQDHCSNLRINQRKLFILQAYKKQKYIEVKLTAFTLNYIGFDVSSKFLQIDLHNEFLKLLELAAENLKQQQRDIVDLISIEYYLIY